MTWRCGPEELPEYGVAVLVWWDKHFTIAKRVEYAGPGKGQWEETNQGGYSDGCSWGNDWPAHEPTYWMPLPKAPEE